MNPDRTPEKQGMELPPVAPEQQVPSADNQVRREGTERNPELLPNNQGNSNDFINPGTPSATPQQPTQQSLPGTRIPTPSHPVDPGTATLIADDSDLIEKEWVERAKEIVHKTKDNPYLQNKAITKMKVDYIKKRYGKDIKFEDK